MENKPNLENIVKKEEKPRIQSFIDIIMLFAIPILYTGQYILSNNTREKGYLYGVMEAYYNWYLKK